MSLSRHEQRILEDIEKGLEQDDPGFAEQVTRTTLQWHLARRVIGWVAGASPGDFT